MTERTIILIAISENPTRDYPFAVTLGDSEELLCATMRDAEIVANAMQHAAMAYEDFQPTIKRSLTLQTLFELDANEK